MKDIQRERRREVKRDKHSRLLLTLTNNSEAKLWINVSLALDVVVYKVYMKYTLLYINVFIEYEKFLVWLKVWNKTITMHVQRKQKNTCTQKIHVFDILFASDISTYTFKNKSVSNQYKLLG